MRFAIVALVVVTLVACGGGGDKSDDGSSASSTPPSTIQVAGVSAVVRGEKAATDGMDVEIDDNYFKPNILTGASGRSVTLKFDNEGKSLHNVSISEQSISQDVEAGKSASVKVTFPSTGEVAFFCKYHKDESGMAGVLRVGP